MYVTYVYEKNYVNVDAAVDVLPKGFLYFFIAQQYNSKGVNQTMSLLKGKIIPSLLVRVSQWG